MANITRELALRIAKKLAAVPIKSRSRAHDLYAVILTASCPLPPLRSVRVLPILARSLRHDLLWSAGLTDGITPPHQ